MLRSRRKAGNKDKVFGCDLLAHLNASSQEVPTVLQCCAEFIEQHGVVDGIYRLSGVSSNIQKLRSEFEGDGHPDLNKDLYLQDIHCVSSLCKAYFRELPNPLLTYQLYDKFAEAVAIQLEEERLMKIREVLKELPAPHHRTLEFLMCHLVRMASHSSETNMHARNLAIVWAPNLLRSKDIEVSGFNGTAAFMEVRVQSIVVEFILTHVPQLFPDQGVLLEKRKSLPSPSLVSSKDDGVFKSSQVPANFGNISPGDGPLPIRPYHAIIEGTDKRKGSLKGRKWMSIFNIGGKFHDPRRRHKNSSKGKEHTSLRPARSMDSISNTSYPSEGSRRPAQNPLSTNMSGFVPSKGELPSSPMGGSEYAVTYRRGTGLVSGGTQGTYTALDPEGLGTVDGDPPPSRSPSLAAKACRRAAVHITVPTIVTVPLHITSNLALKVLQGGGGDRVVHRSRERKEKEDGVRSDGAEKKVEEGKPKRQEVPDEGGEPSQEVEEKEEEEAAGSRAQSLTLNVAERNEEDDAAADDREEGNHFTAEGGEPYEVLNSTAIDAGDQRMSGFVEDNFEFLDQLDCSAMDHLDSSRHHQVREFSVEPPFHSDEYEHMEAAESRTPPGREVRVHRAASAHRHSKSLSLPHMTSPVLEPHESTTDEEDQDEQEMYSSEDEDDMFIKSLPPDFLFKDLKKPRTDGDERDSAADGAGTSTDEEQEEERGELGQDGDQAEGGSASGETDEAEIPLPEPEDAEDHAAPDAQETDLGFPPPPPCWVAPLSPVASVQEPEGRGDGETNESWENWSQDGGGNALHLEVDALQEGTGRRCEGDEGTTGADIWEELEEVVCEVIEDAESANAGENGVGDISAGVEEEQMEAEERSGTGGATQEDHAEEGGAGDERPPSPASWNRPEVEPEGDRVKDNWREEEEEERAGGGVGRLLVISKTPAVKVYQAKAVPVVPPKPQHCKLTALTLRQERERREAASSERPVAAGDTEWGGGSGTKEP